MPRYRITVEYTIEADTEDEAVGRVLDGDQDFDEVQAWEVDANGNAVEGV